MLKIEISPDAARAAPLLTLLSQPDYLERIEKRKSVFCEPQKEVEMSEVA